MKLLIGSHVNFNEKQQLLGAAEKAYENGANAFMIYTGSAQNTIRKPIDELLTKKAWEFMIEKEMYLDKVIVHSPYIINLANNKNEQNRFFAISFLITELKRCEQLGIKLMVIHPGNHVGLGLDLGIINIAEALNKVIEETSSVTILLETMAGKGTEIGGNFEELKLIIDKIDKKDRIGVCFDTCHTNDAGYYLKDFDEILSEFDEKIGLNYLKCIHLNDSLNERGIKKDRHQNIGFGTIGFDTLSKVIYHKKLENVPKILETPFIPLDETVTTRDLSPYKAEIKMIKNNIFDPDLYSNIRSE